MAIRIKCEECGKIANVPEDYAGKRAKCSCGATIMIPPAVEQPSQEAAKDETAQDEAAPSKRRASRTRSGGRRPAARRPRQKVRAPKGHRKGAKASRFQTALLCGGGVALVALVLVIVLVSRGGPAALDSVVD